MKFWLSIDLSVGGLLSSYNFHSRPDEFWVSKTMGEIPGNLVAEPRSHLMAGGKDIGRALGIRLAHNLPNGWSGISEAGREKIL